MLIDILLVALFFERIGHIAISKGRRPWPYRFLALGVCLVAWLLSTFLAGIMMGTYAQLKGIPLTKADAMLPGAIVSFLSILGTGSALWFIIKNLPETQNAIGESYLFIQFPCTECGERIEFKRHHAGLMVDCPKCKRKVLVPEETVPAEPPPLPEEITTAEQPPSPYAKPGAAE